MTAALRWAKRLIAEALLENAYCSAEIFSQDSSCSSAESAPHVFGVACSSDVHGPVIHGSTQSNPELAAQPTLVAAL